MELTTQATQSQRKPATFHPAAPFAPAASPMEGCMPQRPFFPIRYGRDSCRPERKKLFPAAATTTPSAGLTFLPRKPRWWRITTPALSTMVSTCRRPVSSAPGCATNMCIMPTRMPSRRQTTLPGIIATGSRCSPGLPSLIRGVPRYSSWLITAPRRYAPIMPTCPAPCATTAVISGKAAMPSCSRNSGTTSVSQPFGSSFHW